MSRNIFLDIVLDCIQKGPKIRLINSTSYKNALHSSSEKTVIWECSYDQDFLMVDFVVSLPDHTDPFESIKKKVGDTQAFFIYYRPNEALTNACFGQLQGY